jgi:DUF1680 family protein
MTLKKIALICCIFFSTYVYPQEGYPYRVVPIKDVKITDDFWSARLNAYFNGTIPAAIVQVRDSTSRINNFEVAAGVKKGKYNGLVWDDSDVYKVMEGMANSLQIKADPEIEKLMDYWTDLFAKAQSQDGYLNTFFMLSQEDDGLGKNLGRWSDMGRHEMYCAGHLIEAAIAYEKATGKKKLLYVAQKFADNILATFGPFKRRWVPLHQEIELALVKLYTATNERKYLDFAKWLLEERGHGREAGPMWGVGGKKGLVDCQTDIPVKDVKEAWGHAVRAMYMYSGMLDVAVNLKDSTYLPAVNHVWQDAIPAKMYITGGIGARRDGEAFGAKYELPNKEAYCETCSSVGMVLWNSRMNHLYGDAKYANVVERTLYNALLAGMSLDGRKFFYTNPLEADGRTHRGEKYGIACCPSNMARFIPSIGSYIYNVKNDELLVNLFIGSETKTSLNYCPITILQKTDYPFGGNVSLTINPEKPVNGKIKLLIPEWCKSYIATLNGKKVSSNNLQLGYLTLDRKWRKGDVITLDFDMPVLLVESAPQVKGNAGKRAVQKGPLVYCMEQVDNPGVDLSSVVLTAKNKFNTLNGGGILKGVIKLQTIVGSNKITFIPYYAWENRESGKMLVWVKYL